MEGRCTSSESMKEMQKAHEDKVSRIQELKGKKEAMMVELQKLNNENPERMKSLNELSEEYMSRRDKLCAILAQRSHHQKSN